MSGQQGVAIKVSLAGAAAARRDANSTGKAIKGIGTESEHSSRRVRLAEKSMERLEHTSHRLRHTIRELAGVTGFAGLAFGSGEIVKSAIDAQNSQVKLQQTLKNAGLSWHEYGKEIEEATDKTAMRTGFSPAQVTDSLSNLIRTTHNVGKAQKLNNTVLDLARTKNLSLAGASSLLARVYTGNYKGLNRLGIAITPVTVQQDKLKASGQKYTVAQLARAKADDKAATATQALSVVSRTFAGQAGKFANHTLQGQMDRLKASLEVAQEKLGLVVLPYMIEGANKLTTLLKKLIENWPKISAAIKREAGKVKATVSDLVKKLLQDWPKIKRDAEKAKTALAPLLDWISTHRKGVAEFAIALAGVGAGLRAIRKVGHFTGLGKIAGIAAGKGGLGRLVSKYGGATPVYVVNWGGKMEKTSLPKKVLGAAKKYGPGGAVAADIAAGAGGGALAGAAGVGLAAAAPLAGITWLAIHGKSNNVTRGPGSKPAGYLSGGVSAPGFGAGMPGMAPVSPAAVTVPYTPSAAGSMILNGGAGSPFVIHTSVNVDGKTIARAVTHAAHKQAALK